MNLSKLESLIYNYSINIIGFNMTLKKANLNNQITSEIVNMAGALNTIMMDSLEFEGRELNLQIGQCIKITDSIQALLNKLEFEGKCDDEKTKLQIETTEILKSLELFIAENI